MVHHDWNLWGNRLVNGFWRWSEACRSDVLGLFFPLQAARAHQKRWKSSAKGWRERVYEVEIIDPKIYLRFIINNNDSNDNNNNNDNDNNDKNDDNNSESGFLDQSHFTAFTLISLGVWCNLSHGWMAWKMIALVAASMSPFPVPLVAGSVAAWNFAVDLINEDLILPSGYSYGTCPMYSWCLMIYLLKKGDVHRYMK